MQTLPVIQIRIDDLTLQINQTLQTYQSTQVDFLVEYLREIGRQLNNFKIEFLYPSNFVINLDFYKTTATILSDILIQMGLESDVSIMNMYQVYYDAIYKVDLIGLM